MWCSKQSLVRVPIQRLIAQISENLRIHRSFDLVKRDLLHLHTVAVKSQVNGAYTEFVMAFFARFVPR